MYACAGGGDGIGMRKSDGEDTSFVLQYTVRTVYRRKELVWRTKILEEKRFPAEWHSKYNTTYIQVKQEQRQRRCQL